MLEIKLNLKDKEIILTTEEARELYGELLGIFGNKLEPISQEELYLKTAGQAIKL